MGAICNKQKKSTSDCQEKDIDKTIESLTYDSYLLENEVMKQKKILPLYNHIKKLHLTQIDTRLSEIQKSLIKTILDKLDLLINNYYVESSYREKTEKLIELQNNIRQTIIICHLLIEEIKLNKQPQWINDFCSQQTEELEKQFNVHVNSRNKYHPIINLIILIIECIKSECPWLRLNCFTNQVFVSKQAERSNQLQNMYSVY